MKKILTLSLLLMAGVILLAGCTKRHYYDEWNDYNDDESGIVVYISEVNSPYSVIRMDYDGQYAVVYSVDDNVKLWPEIDDVIYGDFTIGGSRKVYNKTIGKTIRLEVDDFFKYKNDAINSVIRKEDSEGYVSSFKKSSIKLQRRAEVIKPAVK